MSNKNVTLPQLQKSVSNVKNYIDYNNILTTLTSNDGCIPYRLVLTEEEIGDSYNKTITSTSISKDMFEEIYNSAECIEIWIKNNDETTNSGHDFFYETGYISGSYGTNNGLRKKIFSKKIFDPIFKASGNCCNYLKINYIFEEQEDSTITLKTEHLDSISYNIDLFPIIRFENDNNKYIAVYDLKNALYLSNINLSDTDGLILKTDIKNIDLYNIYGNNCIVSCSVENNNVSLILPDRIIKGEIKSKTSIILSNTTEILFSDDIKKYVDDKVASLVDSAPETLDILKELSTALGDDPNFATTMATTLGNKVDKVDGKTLSTNDLTNELKANYDVAYTHSQSAHFNGDYNSLSNIPTDLVKTSDADSKYAPIDSPNFTTSISMGRKADTTIGNNSVAIGIDVEASGNYSFANGINATASDYCSHAEGNYTIASGGCSHAEGSASIASGTVSHAEGNGTKAKGYISHAEGLFTTASSNFQHVQGKCNIEDTDNKYAHIVGNGTYDAEYMEVETRSNAHTLDWSGNAWYQGDVYVGGNSQDDTNAKKMATEEFVNNNKITKTSELTNDSGFITSIPDEYITETELIAKNYIDNTTLENKGYLTEHQSLKGLATETYIDSKFKSEEIIFDGETNDPLIIHDYYTQHPAAGGMGCLVIDKSIEINSNNNPYYLDMDGTIYPPDKSTYNSTNNAWEYSIDNGMDVFIGNDYEGQNKIVVSWDPVNYSHLKIYTKIDLIESINNKADKSQLVGLATENYVNNRFLNIDIASTSWVQNSGGLYELTYTHNLASENITVQVYNTDSKYEMFVDTQIVDANNIKITSDENPNCAIRIVKF